MPAVGCIARFDLPPAGRDQRGGLRDHGAARSAVPGPAVLRLAADGGMAGDPGPSCQPQTGPAPDAARRPGGDLPATEYEQAGTGAQDLPLPAGRDLDRAGQSGLVRGRHLHPDGQGLPLPGASAPGSASITRSASTRASAIARRARPTKQNAHGYVDDRLRRPAVPSPTSPPAQPPTTGLILTSEKVGAMS